MSSVEKRSVSALLEKTRRINKLFESHAGQPMDYDKVAHLLAEVIQCNVFLLHRGGSLLGYALSGPSACEFVAEAVLVEKRFPEEFNRRLLKTEATKVGMAEPGRCLFDPDHLCSNPDQEIAIVPLCGDGERLGTLVLSRASQTFSDEDLILAESGAAVVSMETLRVRFAMAESDARKKAAVRAAFATLSYSELEAIHHVFSELGETEGMFVASKVADRVGITRSVIVNALRKLESAGVIESRSLGMKGTYIRVINLHLMEELTEL